MPISNEPSQPQIIIKKEKSVGLALILGILFGPLGMLYTTVIGGIIMFFVSLFLAIFTLGLSMFVTQPVCAVWSVIAANNYNNKLHSQA